MRKAPASGAPIASVRSRLSSGVPNPAANATNTSRKKHYYIQTFEKKLNYIIVYMIYGAEGLYLLTRTEEK
jgi:hypothetical protein